MYQKYHTDALILGSRERGEADKILALYTKDFGLIHARASAVRRERSRMRYALQDYSSAHVSLVRGKRLWRVGGAIATSGVPPVESAAAFARIARLVIRLVGGEEQNQYLFSTLTDAHTSLALVMRTARPVVEMVCVARVLYALGYLSPEALELPIGQAGTTLFTHTAYAARDIEEAQTMRATLLSSINHALTETHL